MILNIVFLCCAARSNHVPKVEMAVLLLDRDPLLLDAVDGEGQTALHYAASCAHVDLVALLLERGADKTIQDGDGLTPCNSEKPVRRSSPLQKCLPLKAWWSVMFY